MLQAFSSISALLIGVGILNLGYGLLGTLLAVRMSVEGFTGFVSGLVMASYFLGLMIGSMTAHRLIQAVGHIRTFSALASVFSAATLIHVFVVEPLAWSGLRIVEGFCMAGLFMCVESWLNDRATNETRGKVLSLYMITTYLFGALAQFLLVTGEVTGFFLFALTSVLCSLALVPIAMTRSPAPALPERSLFGLKRLLEISPLGVAGCFASGMASGAFYGVLPRYGAIVGLDNLGIASLMGFCIFGGLLFQFPVGRLSDRFDRRWVIAGVAMLMVVFAALIVGFTFNRPVTAEVEAGAAVAGGQPLALWMIVLIAAFGGMLFSLYPLSLSHANDFIEAKDFVAASGGLILFYSLGAVFGPIGAGAVMGALGPWGLFVYMGGIGIALAAFAAWRSRVAPPADELKSPFQATARAAFVVSDLDPRAEDDQLSFDFYFPTAAEQAAADAEAADHREAA